MLIYFELKYHYTINEPLKYILIVLCDKICYIILLTFTNI